MKHAAAKTMTLVIPGNLSTLVYVVGETAKALCLRADTPDSRGTAWLPKAALKRNEQYSYKTFEAYELARWCRLDRNQQKALGMLA